MIICKDDVKTIELLNQAPSFKALFILDKNPTAENIVVVIWNKLRARLRSNLDLEITLHETARNSVFYAGK